MSEDALYLMGCYLIYSLSLAILTVKSPKRLRTVSINLVILIAYSGPLLLALNYASAGGTGLVWLVYLMIALGVHWVVNLIGIGLLMRPAS